VVQIRLDRMENETPLNYHKRLIYGKLVDKTLSDMDYTELSQYVYGRPYSSDVARRLMYGSKYTLELMDRECSDKISDKSLLSEIELKTAELKKERQRLSDQRREYNKLISSEGRREHLYDSLKEAAENLSTTVGELYTPWERDDSVASDYSDKEAVLVFGDWHYGMKTDNVFNTYDTSICRERVRRVVDNAIHRLKLHRCGKLHIIILGDLFHGAIHTSARVASEELVCDQIMQVSEILAQSICELAAYVDEATVYMTYGNHGRTVQNKMDNIHRDNMERLIPWWLKQRLSGCTNITISDEPDNEFVVINVAGHDIAASHGDLDSVRNAPRLFSGIFDKYYQTDIEYIILGDKHHTESFNELGITAEICGSLCGTDDYANNKRLFSRPSQLMLIVDRDYGIDAEYRLKCD